MAISLVTVVVLIAAALRAFFAERRAAGALLCAALLVTALLELFDLGALSGIAAEFPWKRCALLAEGLLPALWLASSLSYAREGGARHFSRSAKVLVPASLLLVAAPALLSERAFFYAPDFPAEPLLFLTNIGCYYYVAIMALLVLALKNFESTLVSASPEALWRVKLDVIALGAILAVLVFYYSHALLYRTLNMEYVSLRSTMFAVAAVMMSYSRMHFRGAARVRVSHTAALKSVVLAAVACYLIFLGVLGAGMQYLGEFFPRALGTSLAFLAGVALLMVLSSRRLKREVQVFMHKHFYQSKYDYRAQWLRLTERLASAPAGDALLTNVLSAYCETFSVEGAALFLHQERFGWYCATAIEQLETFNEVISGDNLLVAYLKSRRWVFSARDDNPEILRENEVLFRKHQVSFVIPLWEKENLIGFIALGALAKPDEPFRYEDYDLMKAIARQASLAIQHQRLSEELTRAQAVEAVGSLATFVAHDLKNQVATVSLIVENAKQHLANPEFQEDMLGALGNTVQNMQRLIARLKNLGEHEYLQLLPVDLLDLVSTSARSVGGHVRVSGTRQMILADGDEMQKVVLNLLLNAIEATEDDAPIAVEVGGNEAPYLRVIDHGCGMSPSFLRRELFTPFRTTKKQGLGIGLYQCRQIVEAHGGRIEVTSVEGKGTVFTVWLQAPDGPRPEDVQAVRAA